MWAQHGLRRGVCGGTDGWGVVEEQFYEFGQRYGHCAGLLVNCCLCRVDSELSASFAGCPVRCSAHGIRIVKIILRNQNTVVNAPWETFFRRAPTIGKWSEELVARSLVVHARLPNKSLCKPKTQIVGISENCEEMVTYNAKTSTRWIASITPTLFITKPLGNGSGISCINVKIVGECAFGWYWFVSTISTPLHLPLAVMTSKIPYAVYNEISFKNVMRCLHQRCSLCKWLCCGMCRIQLF